MQEYIPRLVTIAIPAYKSAYLAEAIDSALAQDYTDIELLIINDKSPHDVDAVVARYSDPRIRYYVNPKNLGKKSPVANWNRCIDLARGEFFVLLADDDLLMPSFVSELLKLADKYPDCNVFHARRKVIHQGSDQVEIDPEWAEWESLDEFVNNKRQRLRGHTMTEFLYRTEYIERIKYVDFPLAWGSDEISIINFIKEGGVASSNGVLAVFRWSDIQISQPDKNLVEKSRARILNNMWLSMFFKNEKFHKEYRYSASYNLMLFMNHASFIDRFRILIITPTQVWSVKTKLKLFKNILLGRMPCSKEPWLGA